MEEILKSVVEKLPTESKKLFSIELKIFLRDFVVAYLLEAPDDIIEFGVEYFRRDLSQNINYSQLQLDYEHQREMEKKKLSDVSHQIVESMPSKKRGAISDESYNPELYTKAVEFKKSDATFVHLMSIIKKTFFMRILDPGVLTEIVSAMRLVTVEKGSCIMKEGLNGDIFFVIESGTFKEFTSEQHPDEYKLISDFGHFGGLALHYDYPHPSTVVAETSATAWIIDRHTFRQIVLSHAYNKRKQFEDICNKIVLLNELDENKKMDLYDALEYRELPHKSFVYKVGDHAKGMYFIQEGQVKTFNLNSKGEEINVRLYTRGHYFGETAILEKKPQRFTAVTIGSFKAAYLPAECFERVLGTQRRHLEQAMTDYEHKVEDWHGVPAILKESGRHNKRQYYQ